MRRKLDLLKDVPSKNNQREENYYLLLLSLVELIIRTGGLVQGDLDTKLHSQQELERNRPTFVSNAERKATGKEAAQNNQDKYFSVNSKIEYLKGKESSYFNPELDSACVKGRLKKRWKFWEQLGANKFIVNLLKNGYKMPFMSIPTYKNTKNNASALDNESFVFSTLQDLLKSGSVIEVPFEPLVVNPLSVDTRASGKQRLILDLRHVNQFLEKEYVKYEDWRTFHQLIRPGGFLFKFDLKNGYHHVDIAPEHQIYLGFSWKINNKSKYYVFTVLPFGLSIAPGVFTKLLRPLVSTWHKQGINIAVYLDDGAGTDFTSDCAAQAANMTRKLLHDSGFVVNEQKSQLNPVKCMTWLGVEVNLIDNTYKITKERISSILLSIEFILKCPYTTARNLCRLTGKIVSMKFVLSNVIRLRTRFLYKVIDEAPSWDGKLNILNHPEAHKEILFWKENINLLNKRSVIDLPVSKVIVHSDASNSGVGVVMSENNIVNVSHKMFKSCEVLKSSTWRELEAIRFGLESFHDKLSYKSVLWLTDNRAAMFISSSGSCKLDLQELALKIYDLKRRYSIVLEVNWVPRENNKTADYWSKIIDPDDWEITEGFLNYLEGKWGLFSIDRFANFDNTKCERFNSKYSVPGAEAVDAFTQDWRFEHNLFVPPVGYVIRVIYCIKSISNIKGVLIVPYWVSAPFWSLLQNQGNFEYFVKDHVIFENTVGILRLGKYTQSLLGSKNYKGGLVALKINS